jgi:hypothetical protein
MIDPGGACPSKPRRLGQPQVNTARTNGTKRDWTSLLDLLASGRGRHWSHLRILRRIRKPYEGTRVSGLLSKNSRIDQDSQDALLGQQLRSSKRLYLGSLLLLLLPEIVLYLHL